MAKLYAPYINSKLPAFQGNTIIIPFELNRAVGIGEVSAMRLLVKTISTNVEKCNIESNDINNGFVTFVIDPSITFTIGQFYKVQLACVNTEGNIGYYSDVGTIKCAGNSSVEVIATETNEFIGTYLIDKEDIAEKVYSYKFELFKDGLLIDSTGELIHNANKDTDSNQSVDTWNRRKDLTPGTYEIVYQVQTINGLVLTTEPLTFEVAQSTVDNAFNGVFSAELNADDGYIQLALVATQESMDFQGQYVISRSSNIDNYITNYRLFDFSVDANTRGSKLYVWKDFTIEQGVNYRYSLQTISEGIASKRKFNYQGEIKAAFEDMFLQDDKRQLKIRFNPKVSSFKDTIQETKIDTVGGQYPYFFRNGNVRYKEFSISGLISLLIDENQLFINNIYLEDSQRVRTASIPEVDFNVTEQEGGRTALSTTNFKNERDFKLAVLDWLTNGEPKLFRSPSEGSYIVRLMNTSLSPTDALGRMLHTFTCTAYEIAEPTFEEFEAHGFMRIPATGIELQRKHYKQVIGEIKAGDPVRIEGAKVIFPQLVENLRIRSIEDSSVALNGVQIALPPYGELYADKDIDTLEFLGVHLNDMDLSAEIHALISEIEFDYMTPHIETGLFIIKKKVVKSISKSEFMIDRAVAQSDYIKLNKSLKDAQKILYLEASPSTVVEVTEEWWNNKDNEKIFNTIYRVIKENGQEYYIGEMEMGYVNPESNEIKLNGSKITKEELANGIKLYSIENLTELLVGSLVDINRIIYETQEICKGGSVK